MTDPSGWFFDALALSLLALPLYRLLPGWTARRALLVLLGAALVFLVAPRVLLFYVLYWGLTYGACRLVEAGRGRRGEPAVFWGGVLALLAPMLLWKLAPEAFFLRFNFGAHGAVKALSGWAGAIDGVRLPLVPLGLSVASFRALDLLVKVRIRYRSAPGPGEVLYFGFFPAVLAVGPVMQFSEVEADPREAAEVRSGWEDLVAGVGRILAGLLKVYLLATPLQFSRDLILHGGDYLVGPGGRWAAALVFPWYMYFNFAGFSDMAVGFARLYGFRILENFDHPFFQGSFQAFWAHWNMGLTRWCQRNVYVPAGGMRKRTQQRATFATMMAIALWHDLSWPLLVYGTIHGAALCAERAWGQPRLPADASLGRRVAGCLMVFGLLAATLPLVVLPGPEVAPYYARWLGLAP